MPSLLDLTRQVDSLSKIPVDSYTLTTHNGIPIGSILPSTLLLLISQQGSLFSVSESDKTVTITVESLTERNYAFASLTESLLKNNLLNMKDQIRHELYTVYDGSSKPYVHIERALCPHLGVIMYGIHITGFIKSLTDYYFWVPRRSPTKQTYPNMLDQTVAGGLGYPYGPFDTCIKECTEEAGLPADYVTSKLTSVGSVSYYFSEDGRAQPEIQYVYDLNMTPDNVDDAINDYLLNESTYSIKESHGAWSTEKGLMIPKNIDGEACNFELLSSDQAREKLLKGEFKPNCGLVLIEFMIRHGMISPDEPGYLEMYAHCHSQLPFPSR